MPAGRDCGGGGGEPRAPPRGLRGSPKARRPLGVPRGTALVLGRPVAVRPRVCPRLRSAVPRGFSPDPRGGPSPPPRSPPSPRLPRSPRPRPGSRLFLSPLFRSVSARPRWAPRFPGPRRPLPEASWVSTSGGAGVSLPRAAGPVRRVRAPERAPVVVSPGQPSCVKKVDLCLAGCPHAPPGRGSGARAGTSSPGPGPSSRVGGFAGRLPSPFGRRRGLGRCRSPAPSPPAPAARRRGPGSGLGRRPDLDRAGARALRPHGVTVPRAGHPGPPPARRPSPGAPPRGAGSAAPPSPPPLRLPRSWPPAPPGCPAPHGSGVLPSPRTRLRKRGAGAGVVAVVRVRCARGTRSPRSRARLSPSATPRLACPGPAPATDLTVAARPPARSLPPSLSCPRTPGPPPSRPTYLPG